MIVGVTALARAGKDTFADYLVSNYGFVKLNMSDVLKEELIKRGKEPNKLNMSLLGDEWRAKFGNDIVIRRTFEKAQSHRNVVITGIRSPEEVEYLKVSAQNFFLIAVEANQDVRFERRNKLDPQRRVEFFSRDQIDIEHKGLGEVMAIADYRVSNEGTLEDYQRRIEEIIGRIKEDDSKRQALQDSLAREEDIMYD